MHEIGLCESLLPAIERRAAGRQVTGVRVRVGILQRVWEPAFQQAFALVAAGSSADGATVELVVLPVRATCRACAVTAELEDVPIACAACGASDLDVQGGDELMLESLTLQREPAPAS